MLKIDKKVCSKCKKNKPFSEFNKSKNSKFGLHHYCRKCVSLCRKNRYEHNTEKQIQSKYKVNFEFIKNLYVIQSGKCAICNKQISEELISKRYGLAIDHCHDSNKIRGLLCYSCNSGIGLFHDNVEYLQNAINYLKEHKE